MILFNDFGVAERIMAVMLFASLQMLAKYVLTFKIHFLFSRVLLAKFVIGRST